MDNEFEESKSFNEMGFSTSENVFIPCLIDSV
jgi:hypothetical protein